MPISVNLADLSSRVVRRTIGDTTGIRRFAVSATTTRPTSSGGSLNVWDGLKQFGGSLLSTVWDRLQTGVLTFSKIVSFIVSSVSYVMNFNWNMDMDDVNGRMKSGLESLSGSLGSLIGTSIGYLVCGAVPGVLLFSFNEVLALQILKEVGEEALDELTGQVANLIRQSFNLAAKGLIEYGYVAAKSGTRFAYNTLYKAFLEFNGVDTSKIAKVKETKKKPWSFSQGIEEAIESIPNQALENFVENLFEEAAEGCIEAGYVVANTLDAQMMASQMTNQSALGRRETVEVIFNRETATIAGGVQTTP